MRLHIYAQSSGEVLEVVEGDDPLAALAAARERHSARCLAITTDPSTIPTAAQRASIVDPLLGAKDRKRAIKRQIAASMAANKYQRKHSVGMARWRR